MSGALKTAGHAPAPVSGHSGGQHLHLVVAGLLAVLTIGAFGAVWGGLLSGAALFPVLAFLAVAQITLQLLFYMRLRWDRRLFTMLFLGGVVLAVLIDLATKSMLVR